jgi:hypothetical protein
VYILVGGSAVWRMVSVYFADILDVVSVLVKKSGKNPFTRRSRVRGMV